MALGGYGRRLGAQQRPDLYCALLVLGEEETSGISGDVVAAGGGGGNSHEGV